MKKKNKKPKKEKQTNSILEKQYSGSERGKLSCRKTATWLFKSSFVPAVYTLPEATSPWVPDISVGDFLKRCDIGWKISDNFCIFI